VGKGKSWQMSRASAARSSEAQPETLDIGVAQYPFVHRSDMTGCLPARTGVWGQRPQGFSGSNAVTFCIASGEVTYFDRVDSLILSESSFLLLPLGGAIAFVWQNNWF